MAIRQNKRGKWIADYRDPSGKRHMPEFRLKRLAEEHLAEVDAAKRKGVYTDPAMAKVTTVSVAWGKWIARIRAKGARGNRPAAEKTLEDYAFNYSHYIEPWWGQTPLANISHKAVSDWIDNLPNAQGSPASNYAKDRAAKYFTRMLDYAVVEGLLAVNPARDRAGFKVATPRVESSKTQVRLTLPQLVRLADCSGEWRTLILFTGLTGLRWGEVSTLRRKHFEFGPRPSVIVEKAVSKTRRQREVPIPKTVAEVMERSLGGRSGEDLIFPSPTGRVLDGKNFASRHYRPAGKTAAVAVATLQEALGVSDRMRRVQEGDSLRLLAVAATRTMDALHEFQSANGLPVCDRTTPELWGLLGLPHLGGVTLSSGDTDFLVPTFHNLRHTAVTLAISAGANIKLVQRIAGHASATMTLDVYGDLFEDDLHDSARRLDEGLLAVPGFADGDLLVTEAA